MAQATDQLRCPILAEPAAKFFVKAGNAKFEFAVSSHQRGQRSSAAISAQARHIRTLLRIKFLVGPLCCLLTSTLIAQPGQQTWSTPPALTELPNGLKVVVSEDHTAPTVGICVSYGIGFRLEPEGRTALRICLST